MEKLRQNYPEEYRKKRRRMTLSKIIGQFKMRTARHINEYQKKHQDKHFGNLDFMIILFVARMN